jgi:hypothetical protein
MDFFYWMSVSRGATFNTVDVDLYGTGFGVQVIHRNVMSSGYVDKQRLDYLPHHEGRLFETEPYALS